MYLVAGATGSLGGGAAKTLLERGDRVRALVRSSSPARNSSRHTTPEDLAVLGAELMEADLTRPETLAGACDGVRAVIYTASGTKRTPPDTVESVDIGGSRALAEVALAAGTEQFVYVSTLGASPDHPGAIFQVKGRAENGIRETGIGSTILHPVKFMQDWIGFLLGSQLQHSGRIQLVGPGDVTTSFVDEADVAAAAVAVLGREDCIGETLPLSTEATTYAELVERISSVLDVPIEWSSIEPGETVDTVDQAIRPTVTALLGIAAISPSDDRTFPDTTERLGVQPRSIDEFLRTTFADLESV